MDKFIPQLIDKLTRETWENIDLSNQLNTKYGEETITDLLLLGLARQKNYYLRIIQTPKNLEKDKGTDWEWFIGSPKNGWVRFAIQAKKIKLSTKNGDYGLGHMVGVDKQVDILQTYASHNNAISLYCFYNHYSNANQPDHWHCNLGYEQELLGWTITPISNVYTALSLYGGRNFEHIHKQNTTLPTKCLFECPNFVNQYRDSNLINKAVTILGETATKYDSISYSIEQQLDRPVNDYDQPDYIDTFPEGLYNTEIQLYPKRIAIFQIE